MRKRHFPLAILLCILIGCSESSVRPLSPGEGSFDVLGLIQTMNGIRVTVGANTLHHTFIQQGSRDLLGSTHDLWGVRQYYFESREPGIKWSDLTLTSELKYSVVNIDPLFGIDESSTGKSLIRCTVDASGIILKDLLCTTTDYENPESGTPDKDNYRFRTLAFSAPTLTFDSVFDDSVTFVIRDPSIWKHVSLAYSHDEVLYTTYLKQYSLEAFDTLGQDYSNQCRVVFYRK